MILGPTSLAGVVTVEPEPVSDARGAFLRTYAHETFAAAGLDVALPLTARVCNARAGTLRGLHYQAAPHAETKLVSCAHGTIFDVVLDVRPGSPTWGRWHATVIEGARANAVYIPAGCAHGYLTLTDGAVVLYQMTDSHHPEAERGIRWDDPTPRIAWPSIPEIISERDRRWPWLGRRPSEAAHERVALVSR